MCEKAVGNRELEYKRLIGVGGRGIKRGLGRVRIGKGDRSPASLSPCVGQRVAGIGVAAAGAVKRNLDERVDGLGRASLGDGRRLSLSSVQISSPVSSAMTSCWPSQVIPAWTVLSQRAGFPTAPHCPACRSRQRSGPVSRSHRRRAVDNDELLAVPGHPTWTGTKPEGRVPDSAALPGV